MPSRGQPGKQVEDEHERHDEEADRPAVPGGRPFVAVVGEHDPEPHRADPDPGGGEHRDQRTLGQPQGAGGRADEQCGPEDRADRDRRERGGEREREQVEHPDEAHGYSACGCHLGAHGGEQQRPVEHEYQAEHERG